MWLYIRGSIVYFTEKKIVSNWWIFRTIKQKVNLIFNIEATNRTNSITSRNHFMQARFVDREDVCRKLKTTRGANLTCSPLLDLLVSYLCRFWYSFYSKSVNSLTWQAAMSVFFKQKYDACIKVELSGRGIVLVHQYGGGFFVLEHQYGCFDLHKNALSG